MGISQGGKKLSFKQSMVCPYCDRNGYYEVYKTYTYFNLFFWPLFKWHKQYFVQTTCCGAQSGLDAEVGEMIAKGAFTVLDENDSHFTCSYAKSVNHCPHCGFSLEENFSYCPNCGQYL